MCNTDDKIKKLVGELTLEEKAGMLHGCAPFNTKGVERLGIPPLQMDDGPMGVRQEFCADVWKEFDCTYDFVTYLPSNMAVAATWNPKLAHTFGEVLGREARGRGKDVILAPGINIIRTPLGGRTFEYMSEDPHLISNMVVPLIEGIQEQDVAACVKHFALNNQETNRMTVNVEVDERALREIYLPGFHAAVTKAKAHTIMGAYNKFRGEYCCQKNYLLQEILRDEWRFDGVVISDWGAVHDTKSAAENGLDIEMSCDNDYDNYFFAKKLIEAVRGGKINEKQLDEKVANVLRLMHRLKMFDEDRSTGSYNTEQNRQGVRNIARESIVLLKNDTGLLPLDRAKIGKLAVIGENADRLHSNGGGSAAIKALYELTPLMGLKMLLGGNSRIQYARGYSPDESNRENLLNEAVASAEAADTVLLFAGLNHDYDSEGHDRIDMKLPYGQDELIQAVLKANPNTIVVMVAGSPVEMASWADIAPTIVQSWYAGMEGGYALAEMLLGDIAPSGRLPVTIPRTYADCPDCNIGEYPGGETEYYKEGVFVGYRYYDAYDKEPLFCFGHGLTYTSFSYEGMNAVMQAKAKTPLCTVSLSLANTGERDGAETVQLYVEAPDNGISRPKRELRAFRKVCLKKGESTAIEFELDGHAFARYDEAEKGWVCDAGTYSVLVGASSRDIRLKADVILNDTFYFKE